MSDARAEVGAGVESVDLSGRVALVTGSTDGIGRETALALGRLGAHVIVHGRSAEKGEQVLADLRATDADGAEFHRADFADLGAVRDLAAAVHDGHGRLDVLVNNAGALFRREGYTDEGVERTFAVNHLAPFLLTNRLYPLLDVTPAARVVTVSSDAHRGAQMDFEAIRSVDSYSAFDAYGRSKLANVLFSAALARRFRAADADVTSNSLHPGAVPGSGFTRNLPTPIPQLSRLFAALPGSSFFVTSVVEGAETPVYLAASPAVADTTGEYFVNCSKRAPSRAARDRRTQERLWTVSAALVDLDGGVPDPEA